MNLQFKLLKDPVAYLLFRELRSCHLSGQSAQGPTSPRPYNCPAGDNSELGGADLHVIWPLTLPADLVAGSERARVEIVGDLLGPSLDVRTRFDNGLIYFFHQTNFISIWSCRAACVTL